jgi:cob(I)alamin adenosyltransferase
MMNSFKNHHGDEGYTGLLGKGRFPKYHPRLEAIGTIDEANSVFGLARSVCQQELTKNTLLKIQRDLFLIMSEIAVTAEPADAFRSIDPTHVAWVDELVETLSKEIQPPGEFIVPGDSMPGAFLDLGRTVIRRAERRIAELLHQGEIKNPNLLKYLNRLSSLCFLLELYENQHCGQDKPTLMKAKQVP